MAQASRDQNRIPTLMAVSSADGTTPVALYADPTTHRLYVDLPSGSGTVTDVSVVSANGFAGTVATSTTTPAITLSTTITGVIKGNGTAISAASAGTDYTTPTGTENLQNKTLDNTNTVSLKDTLFTLQDEGDTTKQAQFQLSSITTGTTRTYTFPNTSATIVVNSGNQTLSGQMTFSANTNSFGTGTGTGTQGFATGATTNGSTKTVNIGTSGASGSTTTITLGSSTSGATSTTTVYGTTSFQSLTDGNSNARVLYTGSTGGGAEIRGHNGFSATLPIYSFWYNNNTGLGNPASNVLSFIVNAVELGRFSGSNFTVTNGIELGHASDTTLSRASAGVLAVEGVNVLTVAGGTLTGSITLGENTGIALDPAGSADGKWTGITMTATAGATVSFGSLVYLDAATSRWKLADADASATAGPVMLAMCLGSSTDGNSVTLLLQGNIRADAQFPALTIGAPVYVGETAGAIQVAIPTGADNVIRVVGFALTADEIYFNPSQDHQITVA